MPQYFKEHGERLAELGYRILPLPPGSKGPRMKDWPQAHLSAADVRRMATNGSAQAGIGVIAATTPAIDVDILDPEVAERMSQEIDQIFAGQSLMTRTGRAPKFLIPFRSDEPFRKLSSGVYTDGKHDHHVEVLGDGQQWVAYHTHPATNKPYEWWNGLDAEGIVGLEADQLPVLTRIDAQRVIDAFEVLAADRISAGLWSVRMAAVSAERTGGTDEDPFDSQPVGATPAEVAAVLKRIPNSDLDYMGGWFPVLCAVHHELGDAGRELAHEWSVSSAKHTDERFDKTWNSLGSYKGRMSTYRSLLAMADKLPVPARAHPEAKEGDRVPFVEGSLFAAGFQDTDWLIEDVVPRAQVGVIFGASGSGKTFFALDLACTVHRGVAWRDKYVEQADTFYVAAEAGAGIRKRIAAYLQIKGSGPMPWFVDYQPNLATLESVHAIAESVRLRSSDAGLIFIDTLALSHDGDENSSKDMSLVLRHCKILADDTGALVVLVHHTGKNESKGMRGSSALYAGADFVLEILVTGREHSMTVDKLKDGESGKEFGFMLPSVEVGKTPRGKIITSCYVLETDRTVPRKNGLKPLVHEQQIFIMEVFREASGMADEMTETELVEAVKAKQRAADHVPSQSQSIRKSVAKIVIAGHLCKRDESLSLPGTVHSSHSTSFE